MRRDSAKRHISRGLCTQGLWPQSRTPTRFLYDAPTPKFYRPVFTRWEVIVWTNKQTHKQANRRRWKHPTLFATLRRWVNNRQQLWTRTDVCQRARRRLMGMWWVLAANWTWFSDDDDGRAERLTRPYRSVALLLWQPFTSLSCVMSPLPEAVALTDRRPCQLIYLLYDKYAVALDVWWCPGSDSGL